MWLGTAGLCVLLLLLLLVASHHMPCVGGAKQTSLPRCAAQHRWASRAGSFVVNLCHQHYRNLHDALSGHTSNNVEEAVKYSERSNTKCIGITIETRPDYCLKQHLRCDQPVRVGTGRESSVACRGNWGKHAPVWPARANTMLMLTVLTLGVHVPVADWVWRTTVLLCCCAGRAPRVAPC